MDRMTFDEFGNPIFRVIDIPLPGPEKIPRDLPDGYIPKYRHLVRQYQLLDDLWNVQLGDEIDRTSWNLKAASAFWRENLPDTFEGRRFGYTENWIEDAMRKTADQINRMRRVARKAWLLKRLAAYIDKRMQEEQENEEKYEDGERGRSLEKSKSTPGERSDSNVGRKSERRDNTLAKSPLRIPLRSADNLPEDKNSTSSREVSPLKTAPATETEGNGEDEGGAVTEEDEFFTPPVLLSKI